MSASHFNKHGTPVGQGWYVEISRPERRGEGSALTISNKDVGFNKELSHYDNSEGYFIDDYFIVVMSRYRFAVVGKKELLLYQIPQNGSPKLLNERKIDFPNCSKKYNFLPEIFNDRYLVRLGVNPDSGAFEGHPTPTLNLQFIDCEGPQDKNFSLGDLRGEDYSLQLVGPNRLAVFQSQKLLVVCGVECGTHGETLGIPVKIHRGDKFSLVESKEKWNRFLFSADGRYCAGTQCAEVQKYDPEKKSYQPLKDAKAELASMRCLRFLPDNSMLVEGVELLDNEHQLGVYHPESGHWTELMSKNKFEFITRHHVTPEGEVVFRVGNICSITTSNTSSDTSYSRVFSLLPELKLSDKEMAMSGTSELAQCVTDVFSMLPRPVSGVVVSYLVQFSLIGVLANREAKRVGYQPPACFSESAQDQIKRYMDQPGNEQEKIALQGFVDYVNANRSKSIATCYQELKDKKHFIGVFRRFFSNAFEDFMDEICSREKAAVPLSLR